MRSLIIQDELVDSDLQESISHYIDKHEAAWQLGIGTQMVEVLVKAGKLRCLVTPIGRIIDSVSVEELIEKRLEG